MTSVCDCKVGAKNNASIGASSRTLLSRKEENVMTEPPKRRSFATQKRDKRSEKGTRLKSPAYPPLRSGAHLLLIQYPSQNGNRGYLKKRTHTYVGHARTMDIPSRVDIKGCGGRSVDSDRKAARVDPGRSREAFGRIRSAGQAGGSIL